MTDPLAQLLDEFRADVPEPDDDQRARAFARATAARPRLRRPVLALAAAVLVVAAAVAGLALRGGEGEASAATILRRAIAATAQPQSGILHVRYEIDGVPWAGAGKTIRVSVEAWRELGGERRMRLVSGAIAPPATVEMFSGGANGWTLYDPRTDALYRLDQSLLPVGPHSAMDTSADLAAAFRDQLGAGTVAKIWQVTRTTLDGRDVYRIARRQQPDWFEVTAYYLDAQTYVPVRIEESGFPKDERGGPYPRPRRSFTLGKGFSTTVTTISTYETLPNDAAHAAVFDPRTVHPDARELPAAQLRPDLAELLGGRSGAPPVTRPSPPPSTPRLVVDPLRGSIGSFVVGDKVLALTKVVAPPFADMPPQPGNVHDARSVAAFDSAGMLIVSFADQNEEHSTSANVLRPFRTTRGDVNGTDGTTLAEFLARWPEHGDPQQTARGTDVEVGKATFSFDKSGHLSTVRIAA